MAEQLTWWVGDRDPSISDQLTAGGSAVDLSTASVQLKMRAVGSSTFKVDQPVSFKDAGGNWRYDWAAADLDTAGQYLATLEVTRSSKVQTLWEMLLVVLEHANATLYLELEQLKSTLELKGETFANLDIKAALPAACRAIDNVCGRRFYPDADALQVRRYSPLSRDLLRIDDLITLTSLKTDPGGDGTYEETWTQNTDFVLEPENRELIDGVSREPWALIRRHPRGNYYLPTEYPRTVELTGKFGWPAVPPGVVEYTTILATKLLRRAREAPFGVVTVGIDVGAAMRIARTDPDADTLIGPYQRLKA